uniref:Chromo domain-containing protein n=1 Tax=Leptobrachium leishanense TaxID=445787 RepID=A0A8C5M5Y3_9ANUR
CRREREKGVITSYACIKGCRVWLSTRHIKLRVPSHKLAPRFIGPYRVLRRINPVSYALELPKSLRIPNSFHTSLLKPLVCNRYTTPVNQPPPVQVQGQEEYEVQALIDSRWSRGGLQYLVHWKGYGPEERSWVAASDVHAPGLVSAYHRHFPSHPRAHRQGGAAVTVAHVWGNVAPSVCWLTVCKRGYPILTSANSRTADVRCEL